MLFSLVFSLHPKYICILYLWQDFAQHWYLTEMSSLRNLRFLFVVKWEKIVCHSSLKQKQHLSESFSVTFLCLLFIWHHCETFGTLQLNIKHLLGRLGLLFLWWVQHMWRRVVGHIWSCPICWGASCSDLVTPKNSSPCPWKRAASPLVYWKHFSLKSEQNNILLLLPKHCC